MQPNANQDRVNTGLDITAGLVSTIIPTFNRRVLVCRAIESALSQSYAEQEIIVIDDGSSDGTAAMLRERYGASICCVSQPNAGVSSARNRGLALARGEFVALLDSDDEWQCDKLAKQVALLRACPQLGLVLTDVLRVDGRRQPIDVFHRREFIREDGRVLAQVLRNPALVPASTMIRREVFAAVGGFDESLRTAEDVEFHLRVAARFGVGVIEEVLTTAMRGHDGLSSDPGSASDYVRVVERFVAAHRDQLSPLERRQGLFETYARSARSAFVSRRLREGCRHYVKAAATVTTCSDVSKLIASAATLFRVLGVTLARATGLRRAAQSS